MQWGRIVDYLLARSPKTAAVFRPASEDQIALLQSISPSPLPPVYLDFLRTVGEGAGDFRPMSYRYSFRVSDLLAEGLDMCDPSGRFMRVGIEVVVDPIQFGDLFIDLSGGTYDAGLYRLEDVDVFVPGDEVFTGDTLLSSGAYRAFWDFDMVERPYVGYIAGHGESAGTEREQDARRLIMATFEELCGLMSLQHEFDIKDRLSSYSGRRSMLLVVSQATGLTRIWIGADSESDFRNAIEQMRTRLPTLSLTGVRKHP